MQIAANLPRRIAALLLFAFLSIAIVITARNEQIAAGSPKKRSDIALQHAVAANMSSMQLRRYSREIALADPMHAVGFFLQVVALDLEDSPSFDNRRTLIAEASRRQPSFAAPRIWLTADNIRNERYPEAINGADTVMRLNGDFRTLLIPILVPLLDNDKAFSLLKNKLNSYPIWRTQFFVEAINTETRPDRIELLLRQNAPPRYAAAVATERSAYLKALVAKGEALRAYALLKSFTSGQKVAPISDGDFKSKHPVQPFAWVYASDEYSYAEKTVAADSGDARVRAHHSGDGKIALLTQLVALKIGSNRIVMTARDGGLEKPAALYLRVRCHSSQGVLASQSLSNLGADWQTVQLFVNVPDTGCALQSLTLEADDNGGKEAEIEIRKVETR